MYAIFKKEFSSFFSNATGYITLGLFWLACGLFLWVIPGEYNVFDSGYAQLDGLFALAPWLFLFLCPAITMRQFAEEKQTHTWDLLQTKPLTPTQIVLGKYTAALLLSLVALIPCCLYYLCVRHLAEPAGNVDSGAFWGAMLGLVFLAAINTAVGLFASTLTRSQIVSFMVAMVLCFCLFYGFDLLGSLFQNGQTVDRLQNLGFHAHYTSMSRGVVDSRDLAYFVAIGTIFVLMTIQIIKRR